MQWWWWIPILLLAWLLTGAVLRRKDARLKGRILIPELGEPQVTLAPADPSSEDLGLAVMCYAAKIRWVLNSEPPVIRQLYRQFLSGIADLSEGDAATPDLYSLLEAVRLFRSADGPSVTPGGEEYTFRLSRTSYKSLANTASVTNGIPRPSLAANIPFSVVVLAAEAWQRFDPTTRGHLIRACRAWLAVEHMEVADDSGIKAMFALNDIAVSAWTNAKTA